MFTKRKTLPPAGVKESMLKMSSFCFIFLFDRKYKKESVTGLKNIFGRKCWLTKTVEISCGCLECVHCATVIVLSGRPV